MSKSTHHTQNRHSEQALSQMSEEQWQEIIALLPTDVNEQARIHKAFIRSTGLRCPTDLLRGMFAYVFCLGSFRQVGSWAASTGLSSNGARSWAKRMRQSASWLLWMVQALLSPPMATDETLSLPQQFSGRVHLVDATHLRTWRRTGESRRLHISSDLLDRRLEQVLLTDHHVGEGLRHFHWQPGDIVVGDSAYCRRQAILDQMDAGIDVVVRLHWATTPLQQADGSPFDLASWLSQLEAEGEGEEQVFMQVRTRRVQLRLLAHRLSEAAAKRAQRKRKDKARKNGRTNQALTIQIADWLVVLTSLTSRQWSTQQILTLYRARWQIELLFKRIKQLVRLHRLRSTHLQSNQAVLAVMLVGWILLEQQACQLRKELQEQEALSPRELISSWALCAILAQSLRTMIVGIWTWSQIRATLVPARRNVSSHRQQRDHQESLIVDQLALILCHQS